VEAPGVQDTKSVFFSVGKETFDNRVSNATFTSDFSTRVRSYDLVSGLSGAISFTIINSQNQGYGNFLYGGAYATGVFPQGAGSLNLTTPVNYFGLWISALDTNNTIRIYSDSTRAERLIEFNVASLTDIIGSGSPSNLYYGNPNWQLIGAPSQQAANGGEPYAFVNFYHTTPGARFSYVELSGSNFEYDNFTVGNYSSTSGTNPDATSITQDFTTADLMNAAVNPNFAGGTLKSSGNSTVPNDITITSTGTIDAFGFNPTFSGVISDATPGAAGGITFTDSAAGGSGNVVTLTGVNTYTGPTTVESGVTLALSGSGSIASSIGVCDSGIFDISQTTSGTSLIDLTCSGNTLLGGKVLTLTNPSNTTYDGVLSGTGGIILAGGIKTLAGVNTYTGTTTIASGATLKLTGSIAASSGVCNDGTFDLSGATSGTSLVDLTCSGNTLLGSNPLTLTSPSDTTYSGVLSGEGGLSLAGGFKTLAGANTYTGATTIASGATLKLTTGSILFSSALANNGTFDISASTGSSVTTMNGSGATILGSKTLTLTNGSGTYSGSISGLGGGIKLVSGELTLSGINSHTGIKEVDAGANLIISAASALGGGVLELVGSNSVSATISTTADMTIGNNIRVTGDPTFNISPGTRTTLTGTISGAGDVVVTGGGTLELAGANTYTLATTIDVGSTLALINAGSVASSSLLNNSGTFSIINSPSGVVSLKNLSQSSTGALKMNFDQTIDVTDSGVLGVLNGGLSIFNTNGSPYVARRYTLIRATSGSFDGISLAIDASNLSNSFTYTTGFDTRNVYLDVLYNGPSAEDTQKSLRVSASSLRNIFTLQNSVLSASLSNDCAVFDKNNLCVSVGERTTYVGDANGLNDNSALLALAYRPRPDYRVGAYAKSSLSINNAGSVVNLGNVSPLVGVFGVWNERPDGTGLEVKVSAAYEDKKAGVTRRVVDGSEPGHGSSELRSQGSQLTAGYGFRVAPKFIASPYAGIRYSQHNLGRYTEESSSTVTAPLNYRALSTNATTALVGVGVSFAIAPKAMVFARGDLEFDVNVASGAYSADGITGLSVINFNANPVKNRASGTLGAFYDIGRSQRLNVTGVYREEPFQGKSTTSLMVNYAVGL